MEPIRGGTFRLNGHTALSLSLPLPPLAEDSAKSWVQVIPGEGSFEGHADGSFTFDANVVDTIVANADKRTTPIKFDYEHDTHKDLTGPKPASGHVLDLERRDGDSGAELWAYVEWTERAAEMIRANEYNYNSPVIAFDFPDAVTGENQGPTLLSVGLTDVPFLDGQEAIQLTWKGRRMSAREKLRLSAIDALAKVQQRLGPDASESDVINAVYEEVDKQAQRDVVKEVVAEVVNGDAMAEPEKKPAETTGEEPSEMMEEEPAEMAEDMEEVDGNALLNALADKTGLDRAAALATAMEKLDALAAAINAEADKDGMVSESTQLSLDAARLEASAHVATIRRLTNQVKALERKEARRAEADKSAKAKQIEARVDALIDDGRCKDEDRDVAIRLFTNAPQDAERIYKDRVVPVDEVQAGDEDDAAFTGEVDIDSLSPETRAMALSFIAANVRGGDRKKCIALAIEKRGN